MSLSPELMFSVLMFMVVALISAMLTKVLIGFLLSKNLLDKPNERSLHHGNIPIGGGLVIVILQCVSLVILIVCGERPLFFSGLLTTLICWASLSWWDDMYQLSSSIRLSCHIVFAALGVAAFGWVSVIELNQSIVLRFDGYATYIAAFITLVGLVWMANLFNFMDGMDGLLAGQTIIASLTLSIWFAWFGDTPFMVFCLILAASTYGFAWWNWHPAKIFMGDVGSVSIGALFGTLIIVLANRYHVPVLATIMIFSVFIIDATLTLVARFRRGERLSQAHKSHYYQRLAEAGVGHKNIVISAYILMILSSVLSSLTVASHAMIPYCLALLVVVTFIIVKIVNKFEKTAFHSSKIS